MVTKIAATPAPSPAPTPEPGTDPIAAGLADLARQATIATEPPPEPVDEQQAAQAEASLEQMSSLVAGFITGALRATRSKIAKRNEFILEEWPDEMLAEPGKHAVPVMRKHLGALFAMADEHPEEAALVLSLLPLAMGYFSAEDRATKEKRPAAAPPPPASAGSLPPPAPTPKPVETFSFPPGDPRAVPLSAGR